MTANPCNDNINFLYGNYFRLFINRTTDPLELMVTKTNLPGVSIPDQNQPTIFGTTIPIPTMAIQYEPLSVEFIVDSDLISVENQADRWITEVGVNFYYEIKKES
jgi:hypothetical protein